MQVRPMPSRRQSRSVYRVVVPRKLAQRIMAEAQERGKVWTEYLLELAERACATDEYFRKSGGLWK